MTNGSAFAGFAQNKGYGGMLLLMLAFIDGEQRAWLLPGSEVTVTKIWIALQPRRKQRDWPACEIDIHRLAGKLLTALVQPGDLTVGHVDDLVRPIAPTRLAEYEAFLRLRAQLPLDYREPPVEGRHYDYTVGGRTWQLKLAYYDCVMDDYRVGLHKKNGIVARKQGHCQYQAGDFDWLAVQLPVDYTPPTLFLIPMRELIEHGLAGRHTAAGSMHLYPHRDRHVLGDRRAPPEPHWTQEWRIDLSSHASALTGYTRLIGKA